MKKCPHCSALRACDVTDTTSAGGELRRQPVHAVNLVLIFLGVMTVSSLGLAILSSTSSASAGKKGSDRSTEHRVEAAPTSDLSKPAATAAPATTEQAAAPARRAMKEFTFTDQGGHDVIATTQAEASASEKRTVVFAPMVEKTDGNLYMAALESLWNLYGKQRGLFQLDDAQTRVNTDLGGNALCWRVSNPAADYCVFPTKDSVTGRIGALTVWVE